MIYLPTHVPPRGGNQHSRNAMPRHLPTYAKIDVQVQLLHARLSRRPGPPFHITCRRVLH